MAPVGKQICARVRAVDRGRLPDERKMHTSSLSR
jgi:hypothetical protein